ncbi:MAG: laccase domain-containing protein [Eggerthellaceae bacterium]|nr:laccase domain-containing protein [Eggerthellaceae bacterium]
MDESCFNDIVFHTDAALFDQTRVSIGFFQRYGGVSQPPFDSLNTSSNVGDLAICVKRNRELVVSALGGAEDTPLIVPKQVHGNVVVGTHRTHDIPNSQFQAQLGADAVTVGCDDVCALLNFADCVPIIIVTPHATFAVIHAGWRGVLNRIVEKAFDVLRARDSIDSSQCNVYIGPHIRSCCFEVSSDVADQFKQEFGDEVLVDAHHVELSLALRLSLKNVGVDSQRICDINACTCCSQNYFSYRKSGGECGRHAAAAMRISETGDTTREFSKRDKRFWSNGPKKHSKET